MTKHPRQRRQSPDRGSPAWWNQRYREGNPPWDSGIVPPEVHELLDTGQLRPPGVAIDLGCGTGTNTNYLNQLGFTAYGVDLAHLALAQARGKARQAGLPGRFCAGDVSDLDFLPVQADFALDIGCLHALTPENRQRYAASLGRRVRPSGIYLLYGFDVDPHAEGGSMGFEDGEIAHRFAPDFELLWRRPSFQGERPVAWYLLRKRQELAKDGPEFL